MATTTREAPTGTLTSSAGKASSIARAKTSPTLVPTIDRPFEFVRRFAEQMDHLFEDFSGGYLPTALTRVRGTPRREGGIMPVEWSPQISVMEREGKFLIHADLPGLTKNDVKVDVAEGMITIEGERKQEKKEESEGRYYNECCYGSFYRAIPLPEGVDASSATAQFHNGVLEVALPLPPKAKKEPRHLEIQEG
jgi:HSP20 family protein